MQLVQIRQIRGLYSGTCIARAGNAAPEKEEKDRKSERMNERKIERVSGSEREGKKVRKGERGAVAR